MVIREWSTAVLVMALFGASCTPEQGRGEDDDACIDCDDEAADDDSDPTNGHCLDHELCDRKDNDCDGDTDEGFNVGVPCAAGIGTCERAGDIVCTGLDASACNADAGDPTEEVCDALDNDCDGAVDEDFPELGTLCSVGEGACARESEWTCDARTGGTRCDAFPSSPTTERCDGVDNDCDGITDTDTPGYGAQCTNGQLNACELYGQMLCDFEVGELACNASSGSHLASPEVCNGLDDDCNGHTDEDIDSETIGTSEGECEPKVLTCNAGEITTFQEGSDPVPESCDERDNDCDGETDEDFAYLLETDCSVGNGECLRNGVFVCSRDRGLHCDATPGAPSEEMCNGHDDDCDGWVDEDFVDVLGTSCTRGTGACQHEGVYVCAADGGARCDASIGTPGTETCNDIDDDCDGETDEDYTDLGALCTVGIGECQRPASMECAEDRHGTECIGDPGDPSTEICDGKDNDCDGTTDTDTEGWGEACSNGQLGVCELPGEMRCDVETTSLACDAPDGSDHMMPEMCNGRDDDCDGGVDEARDELRDGEEWAVSVFERVSAGPQHTCGIHADGSIVCWGRNDVGQTDAPPGSFVQVSAGSNHNCGIRTDGSVVCWGENNNGKASPPSGSFVQVSSGYNHTCGISSSCTTTCWSSTPTGSVDLASTFQNISIGETYFCGIRTDGSVTCSGGNYDDEVTTPLSGNFVQVSAGLNYVCGVRTNGNVVCWGNGGRGQTSPPSGSFVQVSANTDHTCGVRTDGSVACWGRNDYGQASPPSGSFVQVSAGGNHTCGIRIDGRFACWGSDSFGQASPPD